LVLRATTVWKAHPSAGGPAVFLPPGPTTMPTLSPDTQEIKASQLLKSTKCLPLRHSCNARLQLCSGGCVPSPVHQYTGATAVCQGSSAVWNTTLNPGLFCFRVFLSVFFNLFLLSQLQKNNVMYIGSVSCFHDEK